MTVSSLIDSYNTFSQNLASPDGAYGEIVSGYIGMAFQGINQWTVAQMDIQPGDNVLEVGFGPGLAIQQMLAESPVGHITGLELSSLMVQKAGELNALGIHAGRVTLLEGDVCHLPAFDRKFDKIVAINTTMYWPEAQLTNILRSLRQCLVPGGTLLIGFQRLYEAYLRGEKDREIQGYQAILQQAGFVEVGSTLQPITDPEAAIAAGRFMGMVMHGMNPVFAL